METNLLVVCPVITPPDPAVIASWTHRPHLVVVNGAHEQWAATCAAHDIEAADLGTPAAPNAGVARAWNHGFRVAQDRGIRHVAIVSQSLVLDGGTAALAAAVDRHADDRGLFTQWRFHCAVFSVDLWSRVGPFDEGFSPAYFEDMDFIRRLYLAGEHAPANRMRGVDLGGRTCRNGAIRAGAVPASVHASSLSRYRAKWGGPPYHERHTPTVGTAPEPIPGGQPEMTTTTFGGRCAVEEIASPDECVQLVRQSTRARNQASFSAAGTCRHQMRVWEPRTPLVDAVIREATRLGEPFGFDLDGRSEVQLNVYSPGGGYGWHPDLAPRFATRKLSFVLLLSDPATFTGGELYFMAGADSTWRVPLDTIGTMVVFPSWTIHAVSALTAGWRHTLVGWLHGPPFR